MSSLHHKEEREMTLMFCIKVQINKIKVDALFNFGSQVNFIAEVLICKLGVEVHDDHCRGLGM